MSYRALKRVFGETKLELKLLFLFGVGLLLVIVSSFWWYGRQTADLVYHQNRNTGRLLVDQFMLTKHWIASEDAQENARRLPGFKSHGRGGTAILETNRSFVEYMKQNLSKEQYTVALIKPDTPVGKGAPEGQVRGRRPGEISQGAA